MTETLANRLAVGRAALAAKRAEKGPTRRQQIAALHHAGKDVQQIASELSMSRDHVVRNLVAVGLKERKPPVDAAERRATCARLRHLGMSPNQIIKEMKCAKHWVYDTLKELGLHKRRRAVATGQLGTDTALADDDGMRLWRDARAASDGLLEDLRAAYAAPPTPLRIPEGYSIRVSHVFAEPFSASSLASCAELGEGC